MPVLPVTDATFEHEVLSEKLPVLIDLYADWCGPCRQVAPIVEQLSHELAGQVKCVKVDVDRNPQIAASFRVQSIPMLVIMAAGRIHKAMVGVQPKEQILAALEPVLPREEGEVLPRELWGLIQSKRVTVVDARDAFSYGRVHIPGAISVPPDQLDSRAAELRGGGRPVVVYGRTGEESRTAAETLRKRGVPAAHLKGGILEWEGDGLSIERPS